MILVKQNRTKTEVELLRESIPNISDKKYDMRYSFNGDIQYIETTDAEIISYLQSKGFVEKA